MPTLVLPLLCGTAAAAQEGGERPPPCEADRIANVSVRVREVFDDSTGAVLSPLYTAANWLHVETRRSVIRRELLFRPGDCLDPLRLSESERLLRDFGFLQRARVETASRRGDRIDVEVEAQDDWSLRLEPEVDVGSGLGFTGIRLAETNLWGSGRRIELFYEDRTGRDRFGTSYYDPQFAHTRWNLALSTARTEEGWSVSELLGYPFVGLVGHWAAFEEASYAEEWFRFIVGDSERRNELVLPFTQKLLQLGGGLRLSTAARGRATKLGTYGLGVSYEQLKYGGAFFHDTTTAQALGVTEAEAGQVAALGLQTRRTVRLNLFVGVRGLEFIEQRGLRTLRGLEDVAIGASADLVLGLAAEAFGSSDSHALVGLDGYVGARPAETWISLIRGSFEGRRDYEGRDWRDLFGAVEWTNFIRANRRHMFEVTGRWGAGWDATVPFQLTLGGPEGIRGYESHRFPGGARAVVSVEERAHLATVGRFFDLGTAVFLDTGAMWANGATFGTNSGLRAALGLGLRIAAPAGTRLTYRLDFATPIDRGLDLGAFVVTFRVRRARSIEGRPTDLQLERSMDRALLSAVGHLE